MYQKYLPDSDAELLLWTANFSRLINLDPAAYGVTTVLASEYATLQAGYQAALSASTNPETRGERTVFLKNEARTKLVKQTRKLAQQINRAISVSDEQRQELGLTIRKIEPTPVPVPSEPPVITVRSVTGRRVSLEIGQLDVKSRAKPFGVVQATLFTFVGAVPPVELTGWAYYGPATKPRVTVAFDADVTPGTRVWFTATWQNTRGESGPASEPISYEFGSAGVVRLAPAGLEDQAEAA
jgi:hypothetical protein